MEEKPLLCHRLMKIQYYFVSAVLALRKVFGILPAMENRVF